jgi:PAS domain S-box-containing protein
MAKPLRVLIVEDSENDAELLVSDLEHRGYDVIHERVQTAGEMRAALERTRWDVVLSDYSMPTFNGMAALDVLTATGQDLPFIMVSGTIGEETAVSALKAGAQDFLVKGHLARLAPAIERELREAAARRERARAQEALHQSEARFRSLVEHAVFGIYQATLEGRFLAVNPALVTMLGYATTDELLSIGPPNLCVDATVRTDLLERVYALKQFTGEEMTWRQKTGESVRVRLSGRLVDTAAGQPILEVIVEDITERHRLESQLRQTQKMEGIGRLAGGIAHDFNNMLTIIMGYSDMIVEQIGTDKPISGDLREIRHAADRAAGLTRQLLAFSRQQVLRMGAVNVNDVVRDMRAMLQRLIAEDITIELTLADKLPSILADRVQLEQVLMNLAANARDAMPRGGRLTIGTFSSQARDVVTLARVAVPPGQYVTLTLSDSGEGMDARTRERIFEPFFTTKELGKGTGLGLATVYGIVKQLGGYICVSSELTFGTTFTLFFPESEVGSQPANLSTPPSDDVAVATSRAVVLVVEDEVGLRKLVARTLARHGYRVLEAGTGHEGLAVVAQAGDGVQLVISDVVMPTMSGPEMVVQLRKTRPDIKVLYMSGYAGDAIARGGVLEANAPALKKPFTAHDLLQTVRELLNAA